MSTQSFINDQAAALYQELERWPIFDPHSHINPHAPAARGLEELLGYHYYTELAHSAGMPADHVAQGLSPGQVVQNLARWLDQLDNTVQFSWLTEIARRFHDFAQPIDSKAIEALAARADHSADAKAWDAQVWQRTNLEAVFLTNEFDDPLEGWDTSRFVPCLRTDDLVLKLHEPPTVERLRHATDVAVSDEASLREALDRTFRRFIAAGARACAISLPPDFVPRPASHRRGATPLRRVLHGLPVRPDEIDEVRANVFWMLTELCDTHRLPFDLMIGPMRNVYPAGVSGGRDLFDRRVSLADYRALFNAFPNVTFPVSTLSPDAGAELVAYGWIFPNVVPMGHWWYSNIPAYIETDLKARLQAVPKTKLVGYYSDAYKLEFILPKFNMYRSVLARVLAEDAIGQRGLTETQALDLARRLLIENPKRLFGGR